MHFGHRGEGRGCGPEGRHGGKHWGGGHWGAERAGGRRGGHWSRGPFSFRWEMSDERGGPGRGRRRMFDGSELRLVLLRLIADQPRHGYDLIKEIEERTGGAYAPSPGVVYPTLTLLADMGHIEEQQSDGARKLFAVTPAGEAELEAKAEEVAALMARIAHLAEHRERSSGGPPIRRAIGNLRSAIGDRMSAEDADAETMHAVAAILDEAAQKIERL
ncbi:PadR family transcriptional regulator [Sphingomonas sp.]|uniref:PadR family transcriptional regulator n=1 Tax=Sphingomonas sp. TaxID=28214 RepID=UPI002BAE4D8A|nr:PadR family transcriptional regulator [Sphingomonas sp.]HWK36392.1 PadR family transcriptional regulator [Sphingomonas sp.]